jgi:TetR/AcrR family transcriptional regulator, transcriptional repressor for nem operon
MGVIGLPTSSYNLGMRYRPEHKARIRQQIVKDASRRVRAQGLSGAAVAAVMHDAGLTHGGFYKHFKNKDELLLESLAEGFREIADSLVHAAERSRPGTAWKAIVKTYLSPEHCGHAEYGCPLAALGPELMRVDQQMKPRVLAEILKYRSRLLPFMPGRRASDKERAFVAIFSTMLGAIEIARMLPDRRAQATVLDSTRAFLLRSF